MKLRVLFKQERNKSFNYTPRYYNERKEKLDAIRQKYEPEDAEGFRTRKRISFREDWKTKKKPLNDGNSQVRLLVILAFLLMFTFIALRYFKLDTLF